MYDLKEVDGVLYEADCQMITIKKGADVGALNPFSFCFPNLRLLAATTTTAIPRTAKTRQSKQMRTTQRERGDNRMGEW